MTEIYVWNRSGDHQHAYHIAVCTVLSYGLHFYNNEINCDKPFCINIYHSYQVISNYNTKREAMPNRGQRKGEDQEKEKKRDRWKKQLKNREEKGESRRDVW